MAAVDVPEVAQLPGAASASWRSSCWSSWPTSYRQTIHAYPNGGGAYVVVEGEHQPDRRPRRGRVAARRLHADRRGVDLVGRARHRARRASAQRPDDRRDRALPRLPGPHDGGQPPRREGVGPGLRGPDLRLRGAAVLAARRRPHRAVFALRPRPDRRRSRRSSAAEFGKTSTRSPTAASLFVLLRAFSSGAVVLSGVEAISNGVPAFRKPESKNAATHPHARWRLILGARLPRHRDPGPPPPPGGRRGRRDRAVPDGQGGVRRRTPIYYAFQFATFAILILAANTAYADFPQLSSIIARDGYLPRQLANRGDRLVFSNGILVLSGMAARADRRLPGRGQRADPALRGRRVHRVHAVPVRHVPPPPSRCGNRSGSGASSSTRSAASPPASCSSSSWSRSSPPAPGSRRS